MLKKPKGAESGCPRGERAAPFSEGGNRSLERLGSSNGFVAEGGEGLNKNPRSLSSILGFLAAEGRRGERKKRCTGGAGRERGLELGFLFARLPCAPCQKMT